MLARPATQLELRSTHTPEYIDYLRSTAGGTSSLSAATKRVLGLPGSYVNEYTYQAALLAAGGTVEACLRVAKGEVETAVAVVRPPGHHAAAGRTEGFCFTANSAIAAEAVLSRGLVTRVIIVDPDIHHGNGPYEIFLKRDDVLTMSTHCYDK